MKEFATKRSLFFINIAVGLLLVILHLLGLKQYLYFYFWWFDLITHTLGGAFIATFVLYMIPKARKGFILSTILIIAIIWEFFELYVVQIDPQGYHFIIDLVVDLLLALVGGGMMIALNNFLKKQIQ